MQEKYHDIGHIYICYHVQFEVATLCCWSYRKRLLISEHKAGHDSTAKNETIDPNSRATIKFCLLLEWDKQWVSRMLDAVPYVLYFCPHHYGTLMHSQSCERTYLVMQLYQNKIEHKNTEKCRVMSSYAMEGVGLTAGTIEVMWPKLVHSAAYCVVCPAPKVNKNGVWRLSEFGSIDPFFAVIQEMSQVR